VRRGLIEGGVDVRDRGVDVGQLARGRAFRNPFARFHAGRLAVDADAKVSSGEAGDRIAAVVGDACVDDDPLDGDALLDLRGERGRE